MDWSFLKPGQQVSQYIVQGHVLRLHSHSLSDDQKLYKPSREIAEETTRDPLVKLAAHLEAEGILSAADRATLEIGRAHV